MRKLIEFLFGGIIEEIALARADQVIEEMIEDRIEDVHSEMEDRVESAVSEFEHNMEYRLDELERMIDDLQSEVNATKEEIDEMKGAA